MAMDFYMQHYSHTLIQQLEPQQVHQLLEQTPGPFLLDVRTPSEFDRGHIVGAVLIPLRELSTESDILPKDRLIICICESGSRSSIAARVLQAQGYKVSNLLGGMSGWIKAKLPVKVGM
jgi:phage shock protein E